MVEQTPCRSERLLLTYPDAAARLGLSRTTLYKLVASGELTAVHVGKAVRIPADEIRAFVERIKAESSLVPVAR